MPIISQDILKKEENLTREDTRLELTKEFYEGFSYNKLRNAL